MHLGSLGDEHSDRGNLPEAIEHYTAALTICREGDWKAIMSGRPIQGSGSGMQEIVEAIGGLHTEGTLLRNLGSAYAKVGDHSKAIEYHMAALQISQGNGDKQAEAKDLRNLGCAHIMTSPDRPEFKEKAIAIGIDCLNTGLKLSREIGDRRGVCGNLINLGAAHEQLGQCAEARDFYAEAVVVCDSLRDDLTDAQRVTIFAEQSKAYASLVRVLVVLGQHTEALLVADRSRSRALADLLADTPTADVHRLAHMRSREKSELATTFSSSEQEPAPERLNPVPVIALTAGLDW